LREDHPNRVLTRIMGWVCERKKNQGGGQGEKQGKRRNVGGGTGKEKRPLLVEKKGKTMKAILKPESPKSVGKKEETERTPKRRNPAAPKKHHRLERQPRRNTLLKKRGGKGHTKRARKGRVSS